jgi:nitrogen fixation NifU-like protein
LAKGKTIDEALKITRQDVADELDGLPPIKMHCSNLAADALKDAIKNYQEKQEPGQKEPGETEDQKMITGMNGFIGRGVHVEIGDLSEFKDKRVMVLEKGKRSKEIAYELSKLTPRVIFVTKNKSLVSDTSSDQLKRSNVKILYESEIIEVRGLNTVEKVLVHDLNEDEEYELFVDSIIKLKD